MNTVVNKLGFDNGKMRLKSAYRQQKPEQFILQASASGFAERFRRP
ncbi:TPA: hypothetical protein ACU8BT_000444 [Neisseria subflava]